MHTFTRLKWIIGLALSLMIGLASVSLGAGFAPQPPASPWQDLDGPALRTEAALQIEVTRGRYLGLDLPLLRQQLAQAPAEAAAGLAAEAARRGAGLTLNLPMPDGTSQRFALVESPVMQPGLAARYPDIHTYAGQGLDDPTASARLDVTQFGFHAQVLNDQGAFYIDPLYPNRTDRYVAYSRDALVVDPARFTPEQTPRQLNPLDPAQAAPALQPAASVGAQLRTYRLALAATGEYSAKFGGTVAGAHAEIVTAVNRVTGIYEKELAVRLVLVDGNDALIYTDAATDPYTNSNADALLDENQANVDAVIGTANYDIGHVFSTGGGGLAGVRVVCYSVWKAGGETGSSNPTGDGFWVDYVAHEMGHQFGANHTFNSNAGSCGGGNREALAAYEPGSGSTIMGYAGICDADDLQPHSDPYFHSKSFEEINAYLAGSFGGSCGSLTATGNAAPVITAASTGYTIPKGTPFTLTGAASDANGDSLTYQWEQYNLGAGLGGPPPGVSGYVTPPHFRSFNPSLSPARTFPQMSDIVNGATTIGEILPAAATTLTFRFTVRDNRAGGSGVTNGTYTIAVSGAAGPFAVTAPNTAVTWNGLSTQTVTWNVAGTAAAPVSCSNVNIDLSTDGGYTYPTTILAGTPNDGSQAISVPNVATTTARVRVSCANNVFFDISNANFTIQKVNGGLTISQSAAPNPVKRGETLVYTLTVQNSSASNAADVVLTNVLPAQVTYGSDTGGCTASGSAPTVLTCALGAINAGSLKSFTISVTAPTTVATLTNQVSLSNGSGVLALNSPSNLSTGMYVYRLLLPLARK